MKLDEFLSMPIIQPYKTAVLESLQQQIDSSFGIGSRNCMIRTDHPCSFKNLRFKANLSQGKSCAMTGIYQSTMSRIEAGDRLPTRDEFRALLECYRVYGEYYAEVLEKAIFDGEVFIPPAYCLAARNESLKTRKSIEYVWQLTHAQWRNQVGVPIDFEAARVISGIKANSICDMHRLDGRNRRRLEAFNVDNISLLQIIQLAIAYRISPLCLINATMLSTLYRTQTVLGGRIRNKIVKPNGEVANEYLPNDAFFEDVKKLMVQLKLIPEWQQDLWDMYHLSLLGDKTDLEKGINRYYPFPLTPNNFVQFSEDKVIGYFCKNVSPPLEFVKLAGISMPHDELTVVSPDDFYYYYLKPPKIMRGWQKALMDNDVTEDD